MRTGRGCAGAIVLLLAVAATGRAEGCECMGRDRAERLETAALALVGKAHYQGPPYDYPGSMRRIELRVETVRKGEIWHPFVVQYRRDGAGICPTSFRDGRLYLITIEDPWSSVKKGKEGGIEYYVDSCSSMEIGDGREARERR